MTVSHQRISHNPPSDILHEDYVTYWGRRCRSTLCRDARVLPVLRRICAPNDLACHRRHGHLYLFPPNEVEEAQSVPSRSVIGAAVFEQWPREQRLFGSSALPAAISSGSRRF